MTSSPAASDATSRPVVTLFMDAYLPGTRAGGPVRSVAHFVEELSGEYDIRIVTRDRDVGMSDRYPDATPGAWVDVGGASVTYVPSGPFEAVRIAWRVLRLDSDVIYLQSFFSFAFGLVPLWISRMRRRRPATIVAPRGEFSAGALAIKARKKRVALTLQRWACRWCPPFADVVWQASSELERNEISSAIGRGARTFVAPDVPASPRPGGVAPLECRDPSDPALKVLFLSRVVPKKNLLGAIEMVGRTQPSAEGLEFAIAGPKEDGRYWERCRRAIDALPSHVRFVDLGTIDFEGVGRTMARYDVLLFPTFGENYGHVVREAWAVGTPVLTSDTTPWSNLEERGLGWDLSLAEPRAFTDVLDRHARTTLRERSEMRSRIVSRVEPEWTRSVAVDAHRSMMKELLVGR